MSFKHASFITLYCYSSFVTQDFAHVQNLANIFFTKKDLSDLAEQTRDLVL